MPISWIVTMFGWFSADADRASCSKRAQAIGVLRERRRQHLDRHLAPEPRVLRPVDLAHPARAERREDLVGAELRSGGERHLGSRNGTRQRSSQDKRALKLQPDHRAGGERHYHALDEEEVERIRK